MKKHLIILLLILAACNLQARNKVVINPFYEAKTSGIFNISKIELNNKETRIYVHCTFIHNWWVKFSKKHFLQNTETGEKLYALAMEGGEFDKEIRMPASGESSFVLIFPALNKTVSRIDLGEDEKAYIFGVSLDPKKKYEQKVQEVPAGVKDWIGSELAKVKNKSLVDYTSPSFFSRDTARLIGYIKGYDRRLGFSTGIIYANNEITREDFPVVINIHEDGRFESNIPMNYPKYSYCRLQNQTVNFYIEPGQTLSMILNWDEFLTADRLRNIRYKLKEIQYDGSAARINQELAAITLNEPNYKELQKAITKLTPNEFKASQMTFWKESQDKLEQELKEKDFSSQAKTILRNEISISNAAFLFDFVMNREYEARKDSTNNRVLKIPVDSTYYDFLQKIPMDDQSVLIASHFSTFINRFEYASPFSARTRNTARKAFDYYLFTDLGLKPSADDIEYMNFHKGFSKTFYATTGEKEKSALVQELNTKNLAFEKKYKKYSGQYLQKYPKQTEPVSNGARALHEWEAKDAVLASYFKLQPNIVYDVAKVRSLKFLFQQPMKGQKDEARTFLTSLEKGIQNPSLMQEAETLFYKSYPQVQKAIYDLPPGKGTEIFKKISDQYKGKMVLVDFWGIFCGPCIGSIERNKPIRESYKGSKDLEFVFITSEQESPLQRYNDFVKKQDLVNTFRLSNDEYLYLRQLFKFNGIPRYVLINREGQVLNDDFEMYNFENEIKKLVAQK